MQSNVPAYNKYFLQIFFGVLSMVGYGFIVFAAPSLGSGGFAPGATLDPDCVPGDTAYDCKVQGGWLLGGNAGTDSGVTNFIGTTDAQDFVIKTNSVQVAKFGQIGNVAIGGANATYVTPAPIASGANSFALLAGIASGDYSISAGLSGTEASGIGSIAFGQSNTASGNGSVVLNGDSSVASGLQSFAMQQGNTASGLDSTAFGAGTLASGILATSFGDSTTASGTSSLAFGLLTVASGSNTTAFGATTLARSYGETAFGVQNTDYIPVSATVFDSADRLFTIGNGNGSASDAFTILKNGKTGIGYDNFETTSSSALLQVNGNILSSSLTSCGLLETDSDGLFGCGTLVSPAITTGANVTTIYSSGLSGTNQGDPSSGNNIILGVNAGPSVGASYGNYIGTSAGNGAFGGNYSNFIGKSAGEGATFAANANFIGNSAGLNAGNAYYSSFIGTNAGSGAANASNSIFIGYNAGLNDTVNNSSLTPSSILIGTNTSTGGYSDSIAIGKAATNTAANQLMIGSTTSYIDTTRINGSASTQCTITTGTGIACTSDERVKTNIEDLPTTILNQLSGVRTVTYNWLQNPEGKQQVGFLAQNLEQYFPQLVETDSEGMKSVYYSQMTPILVEAVKELDIKIESIESIASMQNQGFIESLIVWLGDKANGINRIFTHELCLTDGDQEECLTLDQVRAIKESLGQSSTPLSPIPDPVPTPDPEIIPDPNPEIIPDPVPEVIPEPSPEPVPDPAPEIVL